VTAYLRFNVRGADCQFCLAFLRIPARPEERDIIGRTVRGECDAGSKADVWGGDSERDQFAVFLGVTEIVQGPKGVIPSLVWLESAKQFCDFRWQMFADFSTSIDTFVPLMPAAAISARA
jgi:hypothetical protein